jgi:hypothetical protein
MSRRKRIAMEKHFTIFSHKNVILKKEFYKEEGKINYFQYLQKRTARESDALISWSSM